MHVMRDFMWPISLFHGLKNRGKNLAWGDVSTFMAAITKYLQKRSCSFLRLRFQNVKSHYQNISKFLWLRKNESSELSCNSQLWSTLKKKKSEKNEKGKKWPTIVDDRQCAVVCGWRLSGGFLSYFRASYAQNVINTAVFHIFFRLGNIESYFYSILNKLGYFLPVFFVWSVSDDI